MGGLLERRVRLAPRAGTGQPFCGGSAHIGPGLLTRPGQEAATAVDASSRQQSKGVVVAPQTSMAAPAAAPAPAAALSQEEQFYASLGGRCRRGFFKDVAWDEACLATAIDAFRVPDRRCYVPDDCGPHEHRCPTIGSNVPKYRDDVEAGGARLLPARARDADTQRHAVRRSISRPRCGLRDGLPDGGAGGAAGQRGVRGDVLGIDVEETLVRLGRENYAADGLDLPVKFRREDAWQTPKKKGEFMFICVGACAQHVPVALCDRLAPGGLLVVPVVATGTRRQAYLMVRRDLRGLPACADRKRSARRPSCPSSTRGTSRPETRALVTGGCSDDEGVGLPASYSPLHAIGDVHTGPAHLREGRRRRPRRRGRGLLRRATGCHR